MSATRTARRIVVPASVLVLALALPATASTAPTQPQSRAPEASAAPARSGSPESVVDRVADFYGTYIDVIHDSGPGSLTNGLRRHYLTHQARTHLADWEKTHHLDGVLRGKGAPSAWQVTYEDSGMGHCWTRVRLSWGTPQHRFSTYLSVQSELATRLISDIRAEG